MFATVGVRLVAKDVRLGEQGFIQTAVSKPVDRGPLYCATCQPPFAVRCSSLTPDIEVSGDTDRTSADLTDRRDR